MIRIVRGNPRSGWFLFEALSPAIRPLALRVLLLDRLAVRICVVVSLPEANQKCQRQYAAEMDEPDHDRRRRC